MAILHSDHLGVDRTLAKAKQTVYWPFMYNDIKNFVLSCKSCIKYKRANVKEPLLTHNLAKHPYLKLGVDFAEIAGHTYLIVTDYYSKWFEPIKVNSKNIDTVISELKILFSRFGIPDEIISDNVPFNSMDFKTFCLHNDIKCSFISPGHSQSNGMVEKSVGIFLKMFKKIKYDESSLWYSLLEYRNSPLEGIDLSPAQLLLNRKLKTNIPVKIELLQPEMYDKEKLLSDMMKNKEKQENYFNKTSRERNHNELSNAKYLYVLYKGTWMKCENLGKADTPRSYKVRLLDGTVLKRNSKCLRLVKMMNLESSDEARDANSNEYINDNTSENENVINSESANKVEREKRTIKKPEWLKNYV